MTQPTAIGRSRTPDLLTAALATAARGWPVHPLRPGGKAPALHGEEACHGTGPCADGHRKWEQRATTDPDRIRAAWTLRPYNVGIATGPAGLLVVDLDMLKPKDREGTPDGVTAFTALCERAGQPVPDTYRVRTPSGGTHLYFTAPDGVRLPNSAGKLARKIDTRAWGGYVVAPGSILPTGPYAVAEPAPVRQLPEWLHNSLTARQTRSRALPALPAGRNPSGCAAAALRNERAAVASAPEGVRNWTLTRAARALGRFVASGDLSRAEVEEALKWAGGAAGLREHECTPVITSALNWSIAHNPQGRAA